ncbi:MAG: GUN4 domain-containing protein [Microcoleaceae cyanobacterium]
MTEDNNLSLSALSQRVTQLETQLEQAMALLSDVYRYSKLRDDLAAGQFKQADRETTRVMLEVAGHLSQDTVTPDDAMQFPCSVLQLIDHLWVKYSDGRFGFSVQKRIYTELGGTDDISWINMNVLNATGDRLGVRANGEWLEYEQLNFSLDAPEGCFPAGWWDSPYGAKMSIYFAAKIIACGL